VASEALTILLAGHETTAHTLSWAFALLHAHPHIAEALTREVHEVAGERELRYEDVARLALSERVVKETLRLYPAAWWGDRVPSSDTVFGDYLVRAHTPVAFSVYVTQRDARFFPQPELFDPDRFLPERSSQLGAAAFLPFGAGVHMCIGNVFALMEARIILSAVAQRLRVIPVSAPRMLAQANITLEMAHPFPVHFMARSLPQSQGRSMPAS
jgi:cytochrome P450